MSVKKLPEKYESEDGSKFDTQAEAERHDAISIAVKDYDSAQKRLQHRLAELTITADGEPFRREWKTYWWLATYGWGSPRLLDIRVDRWTEIRIDADSQPQIHIEERDHRNGVTTSRRYPVKGLYSNPEKANAALAESIRAHIDEKKKELRLLGF